MGKKKPFIDKKRATTYTLVYRAAEEVPQDPKEGDRVVQPASRPAGPFEGPPTRDPGALYAHFWGDDGAEEEALSEARRCELLEYGFPDDGYDYLKHCRVIGRGSVSMQQHTAAAVVKDPTAPCSSAAAAAAAEPHQTSQSVYLQAPRVQAPTADIKLIDARRVAVATGSSSSGPSATAAAGDGLLSVAAAAAAVVPVSSVIAAPAAARQIGGREFVAELREVEQLMAAAEAASDTEAEGDEGAGDLLDDFVATAAAAGDGGGRQTDIAPAAASTVAAAAAGSGIQTQFSEDEEELSSDLSDDEPQQQQQQRQPSAAAATINPAYDVLNAQFDSLLSAYDDDHIGDLEGDTRAVGRMGPQQLKALVGSRHHRQQQLLPAAVEGGRGSHNPDAEAEPASEEEEYEGDDENASGNEEGFTVGSSGADKKTTMGSHRGGKTRRPRIDGCEPKVASLAEKDAAVTAAVRARLAAQEAIAAAGGTSSSNGGILEGEELATVYVPDQRERWDCESVLSMRSNVSQFPAKISSAAPHRQRGPAATVGAAAAGVGVIKLNAKSGLPSGYGAASMAAAAAAAAATAAGAPQCLTSAAVAAAAAAEGDADSDDPATAEVEADGTSLATSVYDRPKGETSEERKARKAAVKAMQRDARATKKQLKQLYASEDARQQKQQATAPRAAVFAIP